jgi:membrane associated rhomboid family serine protease
LVDLRDIAVVGKPGSDWWKLITAPFAYSNTGYAFVALTSIAIYGSLLERRHGPIPVIALFLIGGVGGTALTVAANDVPVVLGANGAALAMVVAWAIPDLLTLRAGEEVEGDLLATAAIAIVVALMPLVVTESSWLSDAVGLVGGLVVGYPLARAQTA